MKAETLKGLYALAKKIKYIGINLTKFIGI